MSFSKFVRIVSIVTMSWMLAVPVFATLISFVNVYQEGIADEAWAIEISPDGKNIYVAGMGFESGAGSVTVFNRDATTGQLNFIENHPGDINGLYAPWAMAISPDGKHLYVTRWVQPGAIIVFSRDELTGQLTLTEMIWEGANDVVGLDAVQAIEITPDGQHVYAVGFYSNAVVAFDRDEITGHLTFIDIYEDGIDGIDGLANAISLTISSDGKHIYIAGYADDAVAVFNRDELTGQLFFIDMYKNNVDGIRGLSKVDWVTISPDGQYVYTMTGLDSIAIFRRDEATGRLAFVDVQQGNASYTWSEPILVTPNGQYAYVVSHNIVKAFALEDITGRLTFVEMQQDGVDGVDGLSGARAAVISPEGKHIYIAGSEDKAVAVFNITPGEAISPAFSEWGIVALVTMFIILLGIYVIQQIAIRTRVSR